MLPQGGCRQASGVRYGDRGESRFVALLDPANPPGHAVARGAAGQRRGVARDVVIVEQVRPYAHAGGAAGLIVGMGGAQGRKLVRHATYAHIEGVAPDAAVAII